MTQITGIGFSNFRVFSKPTFFEFSPITIFTGTNSSGKSSVFKAIKLLNNNAYDVSELNFTGEGHKLGAFELAKSRNSESNLIRFILELNKQHLVVIDYGAADEGGWWSKLMVTKGNKLKESYKKDELLSNLGFVEFDPGDGEGEISVMTSSVDLAYFFEQKENNMNTTQKLELVISIEKLQGFFPNNDLKEIESLALEMHNYVLKSFSHKSLKEWHSFNDSAFDKDRVILHYLKEMAVAHNLNLPNNSCAEFFSKSGIDAGVLLKLQNVNVSDIADSEAVRNVNEKLTALINALIVLLYKKPFEVLYLDSIRANAQRLYSNQSQGTAFNELLTELELFWSETGKRNHYLLQFADKWLQKFGIGDKLIVKRIKGIATEVIIERDGAQVDLIDLGYGVTQFLPILLTVCAKLQRKDELRFRSTLYLFNENELSEEDKAELKKDEEKRKKQNLPRLEGPLLLIEEPESNLHPKLQSLLADFFIDVAQTFEVTLLIETHSEYLIRRLQVLTAAGEVKPENSVIYYLDGNIPSDSDKFVRKININPDGSLTNDFGSGFIDEATNWKMELMRLKNVQLQNLN